MEKQKGYPKISNTFVWLFTIFSLLYVAGGYVDGWAHTHIAKIETFFTPYHALFYFSFLALEILLLNQAYENHKKGFLWKRCLPRQYLFALLGTLLFVIAGFSDLAWHFFFGIEKGVDALLSPTHMLLFFSGVMVVSSPLHAIWYKHTSPEKMQKLPITLSFASAFLTISFMIQFFQPFALPWMSESYRFQIANPDYARILGIANPVIFSVVLMGMILATLKHWKFMAGSFMIILGLNAIAVTLMRGENYAFILTALIAGFLIDVFYQKMFVDLHKSLYLRLFGFIVPVIIFCAYVLTNMALGPTWWSVHFVVGSIAISGIAGFLLTYILVPPESITV